MPSAANWEFGPLETLNRESDAPTVDFPGFDDASLSTTYKRGTVLFSEGQAVRGLYLVRTGGVKLSISSAQGKVLVLRIARPGEVNEGDIDKYLGIIETRVKSRQTGAQWTIKALDGLGTITSKATQHRLLAAAIRSNQKLGLPVHAWSKVPAPTPEDWEQSYRTVGQFMTTDLFTVQPDDLIDLAASVMDWRHIRHVPVEDDAGHLLGLITHRQLIRLLSEGKKRTESVTVRDVMLREPVTVSPSTPSLEAIEIMRARKIGCLLVTDEDRLVGILTSFDFLEASAALFIQHMKDLTREVPLARSHKPGV